MITEAASAGGGNALGLTELFIGVGGIIVAAVVPSVLTRRKQASDDAGDVLASYSKLNGDLQTEISRLSDEIARLRSDYQAQLDGARRRITELEQEVATLQRALRGTTP